MSRRGWALLGLAGLLAACHSPLSSDELNQLRAGEAKWAGRSFANYSYETIHQCFCGPPLTEWVRVEVVGDHVARVVVLGTGEVVQDDFLDWWPTIAELFDRIRAAREYDYLEDIEVSFDPVLGYPTRFATRYQSNVQDAGGVIQNRNIQPLE